MTHDQPLPGWHYIGQTKDYLWGKFVPESDRPAPRPVPRIEQTQKTLVSAETWDKTYRRILDQLFLSDRHIQDFHRRNLTVPLFTLSHFSECLAYLREVMLYNSFKGK